MSISCHRKRRPHIVPWRFCTVGRGIVQVSVAKKIVKSFFVRPSDDGQSHALHTAYAIFTSGLVIVRVSALGVISHESTMRPQTEQKHVELIEAGSAEPESRTAY